MILPQEGIQSVGLLGEIREFKWAGESLLPWRKGWCPRVVRVHVRRRAGRRLSFLFLPSFPLFSSLPLSLSSSGGTHPGRAREWSLSTYYVHRVSCLRELKREIDGSEMEKKWEMAVAETKEGTEKSFLSRQS